MRLLPPPSRAGVPLFVGFALCALLCACDDGDQGDDADGGPTDASADALARDGFGPVDAGSDGPLDATADAAPALAPPEPWARPIEDYLAAGEAQGDPTFLRAVHDLAVFEDRLYLVYGDATLNLGRVTDIDIRVFSDPSVAEAEVAHTSREEHLDGFRWLADSLVLPGVDAVDDAWLGNVYLKRPGQDWVMRRTVQNGVHVHDVAFWANSLWAVGSGGTPEEWGLGNVFAHLWRSRDWGESFTVVKREHNERVGDARWTRLLAAGDLYLFGYRSDANGTIDRLLQFRYDGTVLWPLEPPLATVFVERTQPLDGDRGLVVGADTAETPPRQAVWRLEGGVASPVQHLVGFTLVDVVRDGDDWLCLTHDGDAYGQTPDPWRARVWRTADFEVFEPLLDWTASAPLTSLAAWRGALYFGDATGGVLRAELTP